MTLLGIKTIVIKTLDEEIKNETLRIMPPNIEFQYAKCHYAECHCTKCRVAIYSIRANVSF
jgi:hypothetical protein